MQSGPTDPWALRHCTTQARGTTRAARMLVCVCGLMRMCVCMFMRVGACARACARVRACACTAAASVLHPPTCTRILPHTTPSTSHAPTRATRTYRHIVAHALRRSDVLVRLDLAKRAARRVERVVVGDGPADAARPERAARHAHPCAVTAVRLAPRVAAALTMRRAATHYSALQRRATAVLRVATACNSRTPRCNGVQQPYSALQRYIAALLRVATVYSSRDHATGHNSALRNRL